MLHLQLCSFQNQALKIICTDLTVLMHNKIVECSNLLCLVPFLKTKPSQDLNVMGNVNATGCLAVSFHIRLQLVCSC